MKRTYIEPILKVHPMQIHKHLCTVSGQVDRNSIRWEEDEDL